MNNLIWDLRFWLIKTLAGKARVAVNLHIDDNGLHFERGDRGLVYGCRFARLSPIYSDGMLMSIARLGIDNALVEMPELVG